MDDPPVAARPVLPAIRPVVRFPWRPALLAGRGNRLEAPLATRLRLLAATAFDHGATDNRIVVGAGFRNRGLTIRVVGHGNLLRIGDRVAWGGSIVLYGNGVVVEIGDRCDAKDVQIVARQAGVAIGADCLLAGGIQIRASDIHKIRDRADGALLNPPAAVTIGRHVWIAGQAFVGKGVAVPDGCVVGAGSVLTRAFEEPDCVIAGNPARVIRQNVAWER